MMNRLAPKIRMITIAVLLAATTGCTTYMQLQPVDESAATYKDGVAVVASRLGESTVQVMPAQYEFEKGAQLGFWVNAYNNGPTSVTIDSTNVTAVDEYGSLPVWSYDERMKKILRDAMWAAIAGGLAAGANSANAAMWTNTANTYGTVFSYVSTANYRSTTYYKDPSAQIRADADNRRNMENLASRVRSEKDAASMILKMNTIHRVKTLRATS